MIAKDSIIALRKHPTHMHFHVKVYTVLRLVLLMLASVNVYRHATAVLRRAERVRRATGVGSARRLLSPMRAASMASLSFLVGHTCKVSEIK